MKHFGDSGFWLSITAEYKAFSSGSPKARQRARPCCRLLELLEELERVVAFMIKFRPNFALEL
jgi:hypothetical protein